MPIKSVEDLFDEANRRGWMVLNLFQLNKHYWRCNLQRMAEDGGTKETFTEFADGTTPHEAVAAALRNTETQRNSRKRATGPLTINEEGFVLGDARVEAAKLLLEKAFADNAAARNTDTDARLA